MPYLSKISFAYRKLIYVDEIARSYVCFDIEVPQLFLLKRIHLVTDLPMLSQVYHKTGGLSAPAVFLASDASNFVNDQILSVDGGIRVYIVKHP